MWRRPSRKKHAQTARKVVGYIRVSTGDQAREGVSLAAQEARLRAYCTGTERELDEVIVDAGVSAKNTDRPGLKRIISGVRSGEMGCVLVLKLDRLTRSIRDLADLSDLFEKHDVAFVSVQESLDTGNAAGRMITNLLGVLAQFEREQIAERTSFALAHKRQSRRVYGRVPFGYERQADQLLPIAHEQHALKHIRKMDAEGVSDRRIAAWLTESGYVPRTREAMARGVSAQTASLEDERRECRIAQIKTTTLGNDPWIVFTRPLKNEHDHHVRPAIVGRAERIAHDLRSGNGLE